MEFDASYAGSFIAGVISFLSPCVLPLVPPYLAYMAGVSMGSTGTTFTRAGATRICATTGPITRACFDPAVASTQEQTRWMLSYTMANVKLVDS